MNPPSPHLFVHKHTPKKSYRQARSLQQHASEWQQQAPGSSPLLYYYALDFRGEASALHGGILERQAACVQRALAAIAARHGDSASVLVVGHSYGGVVAKRGVAHVLAAAAAVWSGGDKDSRHHPHVPVLVTLGAPHQR